MIKRMSRIIIIGQLMGISFHACAFLPCLSGPFASNTAINDCVNTVVTGNLALLVNGGSGPLSFGPLGGPVGGSVVIGSTGLFTFTPSVGFSGSAGFDYEVSDANDCTATGTVDITVSSPIITDLTFANCSNTTLTGSLTGLVSSGFPPYTFALTGSYTGGLANVASDGQFIFAPTPDFNGVGGFTYQVTDSNNCTTVGSFGVILGSPIGLATGVSTCNNFFQGNLNNYVTGGQPPYTFTGPVGAASCPGASVTIANDGAFSYTAPVDFTGPCSFVYQVQDANACSNTGSLTIVANLTPVAQDASYTTCKNISIQQTLSVINGVAPLTYIVNSPPLHGTLNVNSTTGAFTYTPNVGFIGNDSFEFFVVDSSMPPCTSNIATVNITVEDCCSPIVNPFFQLIVDLYN